MILKNGLPRILTESQTLEALSDFHINEKTLFRVRTLWKGTWQGHTIYEIVQFGTHNWLPDKVICNVRKNFFRKYSGELVKEHRVSKEKYYKIELL